MATVALATAVRQARAISIGLEESEKSDGEVLHAFASGERDAFATLVKRHGPLVLGVCRRWLPDHDADDAFQATFLLLARRANILRKVASLGGWLHGVAYRMAKNARRAALRRQRHEGRVEPVAAKSPGWEAAWREVQDLLDEEIQRLPVTYRDPFILCCVENLSRAEAAQRLGLKEGTVWSRLTGARKRLRERLSRRGVTLSVALAALAVARPAIGAVPPQLADSTLKTACNGSMSIATVSPNIAALVKGANGMFLNKAKALLLAIFFAGALGLGFGSAASEPGHPVAAEPWIAGNDKQKEEPSRQQDAKFGEGWTKVVKEAREIPEGQKDVNGCWKLSVEKGWLIVRRETSTGDLEWQVVLTRAADGPLPRTHTDGYGAIEVKYGGYFVREINGKLRILRERKTADSPEWPQMKFASTEFKARAGITSPFISMWTSGDWCWAVSGYSSKKLDIWLRLQHKDLGGNGYGSASTGNQVVQTNYGEATVQDDGELLVAERVTVERVEYALRIVKIKKELMNDRAPALDSQKWFNTNKDLKLEEFRGKVVLLDFWGTWCGPCVARLPKAEELHQKFKDRGLVVIGVHSSNGGEKLAEFLKEKKVTFPVAHDTGETAERYAVEAWPSYFLIDKNGKVVWGFSHNTPDDKQIEDLLK